MAVFTAHQQADTNFLSDLSGVSSASDYSFVSLNDPPVADEVEFFHSANPIHVVMHSAASDVVFAAAMPLDGTISSLEVTKNGSADFEISGTSFKLADLYADAGDHSLGSIPATIFSGADMITGSDFADALFGFAGNDVIRGGAGNDVIRGGTGSDTLFGGPGRDSFLFDDGIGGGQVDTIKGFSHADDTIFLDATVFRGIHGVGPHGIVVAPSDFRIGSHAKDHSDHLIYNSDTGALLYDRDGSGHAFAQVKFAILAPHLPLAANDFDFIAN